LIIPLYIHHKMYLFLIIYHKMNQIYNANENWNKPTIWINKFINIIVNWKKGKEEECKSKVLISHINEILKYSLLNASK